MERSAISVGLGSECVTEPGHQAVGKKRKEYEKAKQVGS